MAKQVLSSEAVALLRPCRKAHVHAFLAACLAELDASPGDVSLLPVDASMATLLYELARIAIEEGLAPEQLPPLLAWLGRAYPELCTAPYDAVYGHNGYLEGEAGVPPIYRETETGQTYVMDPND
jgi:hypothetical protein